MPPLNYDIDAPGPRKPRPIASSPFWMGSGDANAKPGFSIAPPSDPGFKIPTPMGWMSPERLGTYANNLTPNRKALSALMGMPVDLIAGGARLLGAKGIPRAMGQADPIVQVIDNITRPGMSHQPQWKPSADVPGSSENLLRLMNQYIPPGGLL
ncbi:hypothetical protein [Reyranella soli]|uniref:Uncharacterized protein n=1 Tax=Reyranella soli TaxID=1230389 RepID=A0A512NRH3_9HYPH|nr:hypothetical protein [Reyranella soli]GEP61537.1 hypothetical protein RSO01_87030 [Reyranella soli]